MTLDGHVHEVGIGRRIEIQFRHEGAIVFGNGPERRGRIDHSGCSDNQEHFAMAQRVETFLQIFRSQGILQTRQCEDGAVPGRLHIRAG